MSSLLSKFVKSYLFFFIFVFAILQADRAATLHRFNHNVNAILLRNINQCQTYPYCTLVVHTSMLFLNHFETQVTVLVHPLQVGNCRVDLFTKIINKGSTELTKSDQLVWLHGSTPSVCVCVCVWIVHRIVWTLNATVFGDINTSCENHSSGKVLPYY